MTIISYAAMIIFLPTLMFASGDKHSVSGKIYIQNNKPVIIFIVDKKSVKNRNSGNKKLVVTPDSKDVKLGYIEYKFKGMKTGNYGIRCYQDINGNNQLDMGLFGPKEPWGLSGKYKRKLGPPKFKDFSFPLSENMTNMDIELKY